MDRRYDGPTPDDTPSPEVVADPELRPTEVVAPETPMRAGAPVVTTPVVTTSDRVSTEKVVAHDPYDGVREAKDRFGGIDVPASLTGMLVAFAMLLILAGLASAAFGAIAFQTGTTGNQTELSLGALITAGVVLLLAFLIGGWAAGRMARYSGAANGFMVAVWFLILLAVLAGLGAIAGDAYNLFDNLQVAKANLPDWFSADTVTTGAIVSAIAFALVMFVGAIIGGLWGQHFHSKADEIIVAGTADDDSRIVREDVETRRI
ncbi:MAG: hypothetical protein ABJC60_10220 [Actinomycetota bacterium]